MSFLKHRIRVLSLLLMLVMPCGLLAQAVFTAGELKIVISGEGSVSSVYDMVHKKEYLAAGQPAPLVQIRVGGRWEQPERAVFRPRPGTTGPGVLVLNYAQSGVELQVRVQPDSRLKSSSGIRNRPT
jgi:hypothetical protein